MTSFIHVHRCRDWWDPLGSRETTLEPWRVGLVVGDLVPGEWPEDQFALLNGRDVGPAVPLTHGDHVTLIQRPMAGGAANLIGGVIGLLSIGALFGYAVYKALTLPEPVIPERRDSQTYGWGGIRTAYEAKGLKVPLAYGAPRLGGLVAQRSVIVVENGAQPRSILYLLLELGLGPFEEIAGYTEDQDALLSEDLARVFLNGNSANNYSGVKAWIRMGTPTQAVIPGFNQLERISPVDLPVFQNPGTPVLDFSTATTYVTSNSIEAARLTIEFPKGLYSLNDDGNVITRQQQFDVRYRTVDSLGNPTSVYRNDPGNPHVIAQDLTSNFRFQIPVTFEDPGGSPVAALGQGVEPDPDAYLSVDQNAIARPGGIWATNSQPEELSFGGWFFAESTDSAFPGWFGGILDAIQTDISAHLIQTTPPGGSVKGFAISLRGVASGPNGQVAIGAFVGDGTATATDTAVRLGAENVGQPGAIVAREQWHHVVLTFKRDAFGTGQHRHRLHVDGQLLDEGQSTLGMQFPSTSAFRLRFGLVDPFIGVGASTPNAYLLDDCFLAERELTTAEVAEMWNGGSGRRVSDVLPGLAAVWRFDGDIEDSTVFDNDLVATGVVSYATGVVGDGPTPVGAPLLSRYEIQVQARLGPADGPKAQNTSRWENLIEITFDEIAYRNRALIGFEIDATEQLQGNQPNVLVDCKARPGLRYDSTSGFWVEEWTNNPAWVAARFATDRRNGLGRYFRTIDLDAESFSELAVLADEWVRDRRSQIGLKSFGPDTYEGSDAVKLVFTGKPPSHWTAGVPLTRVGTTSTPGIQTGQSVISGTLATADDWAPLDPIVQDASGEWVAYLPRAGYVAAGSWSLFSSEGEYDVEGASGSLTLEAKERRYQCDIVLDGRGGKAWPFLTTLLQTAGAYPIKVGRKLRVKFQRDREPVQLFNADAIVAGSFKLTRTDPDARFNRAVGEILDRDANFARSPVQVDHPDVQGPTGAIQIVSKSTELRGVTRRSQAKRDLALVLNESKLRRVVLTWRAHANSLASEVGDLVLVEHPLPVYGFGGLVSAPSATAQELYVDKPFTLAAGVSYQAVVMAKESDLLFTADVSSPAGDYAIGARIVLAADLEEPGGNARQPAIGDLWAIGRLDSVVKEVEIQSIRRYPDTLEAEIVALEWDAGVLSEDSFPEPEEDSGSELVAPPDPQSAPQLASLDVTDASFVSSGSGKLEPALSVSWRLARDAYYTAQTVEVFIASTDADSARTGPPRLAATAPAASGRVLVRASDLELWGSYVVSARAVSSTGQREPLAIARARRVQISAQLVQPDSPTGLSVIARGTTVIYDLAGSRGNASVSLRRGVGWLQADRLALLSSDGGSLGPTDDWVWVPTNSAGRASPDILARYSFGRGQVSAVRSTTPSFADMGVQAAVVAVSIEDEGWSTAEAVLDDVVATTDAGASVLELDPAMTAGGGTATYTSRYFDCGAVRNHHVSAIVEARQLHPLPIGRWPALADTRRGSNWSLLEGPLDPSDPHFALIARRIEIRHSETADPSTGDWQSYRPGTYRCRSFQMRVLWTRPDAVLGNEWNVRVYRIAVQANPMAPVDPPLAIDGGTF